MECVPAGWRSSLTVMIACLWAAVACLAAALAYLLRGNGWQLLLLLYSAPMFASWFALGLFIQESALQRIATGRTDSAATIVRRVCATNGRLLEPGSVQRATVSYA